MQQATANNHKVNHRLFKLQGSSPRSEVPTVMAEGSHVGTVTKSGADGNRKWTVLGGTGCIAVIRLRRLLSLRSSAGGRHHSSGQSAHRSSRRWSSAQCQFYGLFLRYWDSVSYVRAWNYGWVLPRYVGLLRRPLLSHCRRTGGCFWIVYWNHSN
ncbi:hypothetical protein V5799_017884 [Amblyomma americanum]|uniref:Uncharacterized protein n=1 Tax=Amblyomma americanum TaxID=6943 RepID=A0AAQ4F1W6_AMBAM